MQGSLASLLFYFASTKLMYVREKAQNSLNGNIVLLSLKKRNFASMTVKVRVDPRALAFFLPPAAAKKTHWKARTWLGSDQRVLRDSQSKGRLLGWPKKPDKYKVALKPLELSPVTCPPDGPTAPFSRWHRRSAWPWEKHQRAGDRAFAFHLQTRGWLNPSCCLFVYGLHAGNVFYIFINGR